MDYETVMKQMEQMMEVKGEKCLLCHFPDTETNLVRLNCGHFYHLDCIKSNINKKNGSFECFYCGKRDIVKQYVKENIKTIQQGVICNELVKSGIHKGKICGRVNCSYHPVKKVSKTCTALLKSGVKKGQVCGRVKCHYHKTQSL